MIGEEVRHLEELIVLGRLVREADAVVERQLAVHLPVVLQVELGVVVDHAPFDQLRLLQVLREHANRRVREAEAGVEGVVRVVGEVDVALEAKVGHAARAGVLRLEAVVVVEAGLARVAPPHLRHTDRHILRAVDVEASWKQLVRRPRQIADAGSAGLRRHDAAAPAERRRQIDPRAVEPHGIQIVERRERVVPRIDDAGIRIQEREAGQAREPVRRVVDEDTARKCRSDPSDRSATRELIADEPVGALEERRVVHLVVDRCAVVGNEGVRIPDVVEPLKRARRDQFPRALSGILAGESQLLRKLIVDAN